MEFINDTKSINGALCALTETIIDLTAFLFETAQQSERLISWRVGHLLADFIALSMGWYLYEWFYWQSCVGDEYNG